MKQTLKAPPGLKLKIWIFILLRFKPTRQPHNRQENILLTLIVYFLLFRLNGAEKLSVYFTMIQYNVASKYIYTNTGQDQRIHASSRLIIKYSDPSFFMGYIVSCDYIISIVLTDVVIEKPHRKILIVNPHCFLLIPLIHWRPSFLHFHAANSPAFCLLTSLEKYTGPHPGVPYRFHL